MAAPEPDGPVWEPLSAGVLAMLRTPPQALLAIGSRTTGFATSDSDYDVFVIGDDYGQVPEERRALVARIRGRYAVELDVHGCTHRHAAEYRVFDLAVNAALRSGALLFGDLGPLTPCPPLGRLGLVDTCISAKVLLQERGVPALTHSAWRTLLLAETLINDPPDWAGYYAALKSPHSVEEERRRARALLGKLKRYRATLPTTEEDLRLLQAGRH